MTQPPYGESALVARYRANYGLGSDVNVTDDMIMEHWELERRLTDDLRASTSETRATTFERCYSDLYHGVPWLREGSQGGDRLAEDALWPVLIGPAPKEVYEVGSGDGSLARFLADAGYTVRATEITSERGDRRESARLSWGITDGVHLDDFASPASYDAVVSNQVVEHLHPDDLGVHLRSVRRLLRPGGRFAFATPHAYTGPHDISRVFELDRPAGMHLREYTYGELNRALLDAGFTQVDSPLRVPHSVRARLQGRPDPILSAAYLRYLIALESGIARLSSPRRQRVARALRTALFAGNIMLVAHTSS
jgi:SAM-dependent methyltransferase